MDWTASGQQSGVATLLRRWCIGQARAPAARGSADGPRHCHLPSPPLPGAVFARKFAFAALFATVLLAIACGETATDAVEAQSEAPTTFPATVEGPVFFDLAEAEIEESELNSSVDVIAMLDTGEEGQASSP